MDEDEVMVNVTIEISTSGALGTGYTLAAWNALTDQQRSAVVTSIWMDEAGGHDNGGVSVLTPGAEGV